MSDVPRPEWKPLSFGSGWSRPRRSTGVVAVLILVVAALAVWFTTRDRGDVGEGDVVGLDPYAVVGATYEVVVPSGKVEITVPPTTREIPSRLIKGEDELDRDATTKARSGVVLVPLRWTVDQTYDLLPPTTDELPALSLVAGSRRSELSTLGDDYRNGGTVLVGVNSDDAADLRVEVEFDGVVQTLSLADGTVEAGVAAPLYTPTPAYGTGGECSDYPAPDGPYESRRWDCGTSEVVLRPWLPRQGWVSDTDHQWAVVTIGLGDTYIAGAGRSRYTSSYRKTGESDTFSLDGAEPIDTTKERGPNGRSLTVTWLAGDEPQALSIERRIKVVSGKKNAPELVLGADLTLTPN